MTSLPISANNPPSSASGVQGDALLTRNEPSQQSGNVATPSQANNNPNGQAAETFSALLARQIGDTGKLALNSKSISGAIDDNAATGDTGKAAKNAQDQTTINGGIPSDQAGPLAAMLLQIPVENRGQSNNPPLTTTKGGMTQGMDNDLQQTSHNTDSSSLAAIKVDLTSLSKSTNNDSASNTDSVSSNKAVKTALTSLANSSPASPSPVPSKSEAVLSAHPPTIQDIANSAGAGPATAAMQNMTAVNTPNNPQAVTSPIGSSAWANEFSQKITWMSNQQNHSAVLHLNPPDLGPLNVVLKISDNQLTAQFTSPHSAVREAVENALPRLREVLADNQIMLGNATVSDQPPRDRSGEGFMNQGSGSSAQHDLSPTETNSNRLSPVAAQNVPARRHNGILDTFA